jgi:hypothetical protein
MIKEDDVYCEAPECECLATHYTDEGEHFCCDCFEARPHLVEDAKGSEEVARINGIGKAESEL